MKVHECRKHGLQNMVEVFAKQFINDSWMEQGLMRSKCCNYLCADHGISKSEESHIRAGVLTGAFTDAVITSAYNEILFIVLQGVYIGSILRDNSLQTMGTEI